MDSSTQVVKPQLKRGLWKPEEDLLLKNYVKTHGEGHWATVSERTGLMRGGKSCRLRWKNYLRPNIKRGMMSQDEEDLIVRMHKLLGNRWSLIAGRLPGRTDNEVKNYWNTHLNKKRSSCLQGKRKNPDSNTDTAANKKLRRSPISHPICSTTQEEYNPRNTNDGSNLSKEEASVVTSAATWFEETDHSFNQDIKPPMSLENEYTTFLYDDEVLIPFLDSSFLFEALGCYGNDQRSLQGDMLPFMP